jgi:hypothetical protein
MESCLRHETQSNLLYKRQVEKDRRLSRQVAEHQRSPLDAKEAGGAYVAAACLLVKVVEPGLAALQVGFKFREQVLRF